MDAFLLDEPLDLGNWRALSFARNEAIAADPEATNEERMEACDVEDKAGQDLAAYQMSFFVGDLLVAWLLLSAVDDGEERPAARAMKDSSSTRVHLHTERAIDGSYAPCVYHSVSFVALCPCRWLACTL